MRTAQSSHIAAHDYDRATGSLVIQFLNGAVYEYAGVPPTEYDSFAQSSSPGIYFWSKIRNRYTTTPLVSGMTQRGKRK